MDAVLELDRVTKRFDGATALDTLSLAVRRGEVLAVVGPSGCGKTTLLQVVAGLADPDAGAVRIAGVTVVGGAAWVPPERRRVAVVFQEHALFPHLSVAENVEFGLARGAAGRGRRARRDEVLQLVRLGHLADRYPHELSGGEQQRVALARALAPRPTLVLLDEPFSSLDPGLRTQLRRETAAVLRASGATAVFVTHDQQEALSVGDRVAVLHDGRLEQCAEPQTVFHAPMTRFAAHFIGEADLISGMKQGGVAATALGPLEVRDDQPDGAVDVMLRPHEVEVTADEHGRGVVEAAEFRGASVHHTVVMDDGSRLQCEMTHVRAQPVGTRVRVRVVAGHPLAVFAAATTPDDHSDAPGPGRSGARIPA